jgi:hypothetical protein
MTAKKAKAKGPNKATTSAVMTREEVKKKLEEGHAYLSKLLAGFEEQKKPVEQEISSLKVKEAHFKVKDREEEGQFIVANAAFLLRFAREHRFRTCDDDNPNNADITGEPCARCVLLRVFNGEMTYLLDDLRLDVSFVQEPIKFPKDYP